MTLTFAACTAATAVAWMLIAEPLADPNRDDNEPPAVEVFETQAACEVARKGKPEAFCEMACPVVVSE